MSEVKTPLVKTADWNGDDCFTIMSHHTFADVIRHLIDEGIELSDVKRVFKNERPKENKKLKRMIQ